MMVVALDSVLDEVFFGLTEEASPHERVHLVRMHQVHPQSAREAVSEVVEIMMRAKCFRADSADWPFLRSCRPLFVLATQHQTVATLFAVAARLDLSCALNDPLYDPAMQGVVNRRVNQVLSCMRSMHYVR